MRNTKSRFSHEDGASFVLYEKIRIEPLRSSERMTLVDVDGNKAALAREYFLLGNEYFKKNEYKASIGYFQSSLKYSYQSPQTHNNLGVLNALISEEQISLEYFKKSIQLRPKQIFAYINLANMQIKRGEYASGIELYLDLLTQYKQKRIIDNFNKIIRNYNNFYKYTKKYIRCAHRDIQSSTLQDILKLVIDHVPKDTPISHQLLLSSENIVEQADIEKIKGTFEAIKTMYSKLHWNYFQSQFNKSIMHGRLLSQYLANLDSKSLYLVVCLLISYFFIEKEESSLSYYFNSLIDDGTPQIKHIKCYQQLSQNYLNLKKIKLLPYLIQSKTQTTALDPEIQKREVINTIERIFFYKKLHMYQLTQLFKNKNKINSLNDQQIEILANTLLDCRQLKASKYLFQRYRKQVQSHHFDYLLQDNILQFCITNYMQDRKDRKNRKEDFNHQLFISQLDKQLYSGECPISRQIHIFSFKILSYFEKGDNKTAIELCKEAEKVYPQKKDKFYQYLGVIYLHEYSVNLNKEKLQQAIQMFEKSILANRKNDESHFIQYCILYQQRMATALRHLQRAIQAHPEKLKYMTQLASVYTNLPDFRTQINHIVAKLDKQYTKTTDFKVKGNIAIYHLCRENFDQSYAFFKNAMEGASKQEDTNCEDLLFIYFVNKLVWLYYYLVDEKPWQHLFKYQLMFYLIIFIRSPFLFQKYDEKTYLYDQMIQREIARDLALQIERNSKSLIEKIKHFDIQHKDIIYPYIFKQVFKQDISIDSVVFYTNLKKLEPDLMESYWIYEVVAQLKQQKILKIKKFIIYVNQNQQLQVDDPYKERKNLTQQINQSTFYKIKHAFKHQKIPGKRHKIINEITFLQNRFLHFQSHISSQIFQQFKQKCQNTKIYINKSQLFLTKFQEILNYFTQIEVICLIFQYFLCFIEENTVLTSFINNLCCTLLKKHNLNDMYFKLRNYIAEDYISQNSNIDLLSDDQESQIISSDDQNNGSNEQSNFKPERIIFTKYGDQNEQLLFYRFPIPKYKDLELFLFAVKLVAMLQKQYFRILKEISLANFEIVGDKIHFKSCKTVRVQYYKYNNQQQGTPSKLNSEHLDSLRNFFQEIQSNGLKSQKSQPYKKCRLHIHLLLKQKIDYHHFVNKVTKIIQLQLSRQLPQTK